MDDVLSSRNLGIVGLIVLLVGLLDPLEGFPLVLIGGIVAAIGARIGASRWFSLLAWGAGLAVVGCAAMLVLSAFGGVGGTSKVPWPWALTIVPYPAGALMMLAGTVLLLMRFRQNRGSNGTPRAAH